MKAWQVLEFMRRKIHVVRVVLRSSDDTLLFDGDPYEFTISNYYYHLIDSFTCDISYVSDSCSEHFASLFICLK